MRYPSLDRYGKTSQVRSNSYSWLFFASAISGITFAIVDPNLGTIGFSGLFVLSTLISFSKDDEFIILARNIPSYRNYTLVTFGVVLLIPAIWLLNFTFGIQFLLSMFIVINGLVWPFITWDYYEKNYTRLFGLYDA